MAVRIDRDLGVVVAIDLATGREVGRSTQAQALPATTAESRVWSEPKAPIRIAEVELTEQLPRLAIGHSDVRLRPYAAARVLVRHAGEPLGTIDVPVTVETITPDVLARTIWLGLKNEIVRRSAGPVQPLTPAGLPPVPHWYQPRAFLPVSVVIATRERPDHLRRCLEGLSQVDYPDVEVIVVDNAPLGDRTKEVVDAFADRLDIRYLVVKVPGGSRARNAGIARATAPIVALTDDDVQVDRRWLLALTARLEAEPDCDCVTGLVLPAELETDAQVWFEQFGGFNKGYVARRFDLHSNRGTDALYPYSPGMFGSGNNVAYRRDALLALGGFDERLGPGTPTCGGEDLDLFLKVIASGRKLGYEPSAIIHHFHRRDYEALRSQVHDYGVGLSALLTKWATADANQAMEIMSRVPAGLRMLLRSGSAKNAKKRPTFPRELTRQEFRGMVRGPAAYVHSVRLEARRVPSGPGPIRPSGEPVPPPAARRQPR